mgnify:CR=1 FL=1
MEPCVVVYFLIMAIKTKPFITKIDINVEFLLHAMDSNHHKLDHEAEVQCLEKDKVEFFLINIQYKSSYKLSIDNTLKNYYQ